jgi:penicillin-binding protein 1C
VSERRPGYLAAALVVAAGCLIGPWAYQRAVAGLGPLDLSAIDADSPVVVDRDGRLLRAFTTPDGRWRSPVTSAEVDPRLLDLLIGVEDKRFRAHHGVDAMAALRAAAQIARHGRVVSGASTLTMQAARLLEPREERTAAAKFRQVVRARQLEARLSKREILDAYLALAPYGGNLEGLRAASLAYLGKEPLRLSLAERALLVALPQSPETRRPDRHPVAAKRARDRVIARAVALGLASPAEAQMAREEAVPSLRRAPPALAAHLAEAAVRARPGARRIATTLDARLQASLEQLARESAEKLGPKLSAAILALDATSGEVRASVGSADYFDEARAGAIDMTLATRSPGSALKPFIYALAFENGLAHPETVLDDRPTRYGGWRPENFDLGFQGAVTARRALQLSLNLPAVELLSLVGPAQFLGRLRGAGATVVVPKEAAPGLAVGLGGVGISLADLTRLYLALAQGGAAGPTRAFPDAASPSPRPLAEPVAAWQVADILRGAPPPQNAPAGRVAYKTGTSYGYRDAVAVGFDRRLVVGVWLGRADNASTPGLTARAAAAPALFEAFARAQSILGLPSEQPPRPPGALSVRESAQLPPPLRHVRRDAPKTLAATAAAALKIAYPPDGARVDLGLSGPARDPEAALALKAQGGAPPFTWLVNGAPVGEPQPRRAAAWKADGAGFARISVMDSAGAVDSVMVRLD